MKLRLMLRFKFQNILMNAQNVFGREFDIIAIHLVIAFGFKEKRGVNIGKELVGHFLKVGKELIGIFGVICDVVLLYKFLKYQKSEVARNILSTGVGVGIKVYPMNKIIAGVQGNPDFLIIKRFLRIFGDGFNHLQIFVVHRVFGNLAVKFLPRHILAEKRKLTVV